MKQYHIDRVVAARYKISLKALHACHRKEQVILARMTAMLLCQRLLKFNYNKLKVSYKKKSHTTARNAIINAIHMLETNKAFADCYNACLEDLHLLKPFIHDNQRRYNLHFHLRSKCIRVHSRARMISLSQDQAPLLSERQINFLHDRNYAIQYSIL